MSFHGNALELHRIRGQKLCGVYETERQSGERRGSGDF